MGLMIEDGKGSGNQVEVKNNKLLVSAVVSTQEHYATHNQGKGYIANFTTTPVGAGDCFLYIKNEDPDLALSIEGIWLKDTSTEYIEIKLNDTGTPVDGTDITPINCNTSKPSLALGDFQYGTDITGLSGGDTLMKLYSAGSSGSVYINFPQDVILGSNGVLTMYAGTGTTEISGMIVFNFHGTNN